MISNKDFKEKQILFVNPEWNSSSYLKFRNDNIVFVKDGSIANRLSIYKVFAVFIIGDMALSTPFIRKAKEYGVSIFFMKNNMETYSSINAKAEGHYLLREKQYLMPEDDEFLMAKKLIKNKILNQKKLIDNKNKKTGLSLPEFIDSVDKKIDECVDNKELLGIEGNFSRLFFHNYFKEIEWRRRAPRTREDIPNFLLDIGYTFLFNFIDSILRLHGFDTFKGFYHKLFFQRKSLACDIIEPFRSIIDKQLLKSFNLGQINEKDFIISNYSFELPFKKRDKYTSIFLEAIMNKKEEIFLYINQFYRSVMDNKKNEFPQFIIK